MNQCILLDEEVKKCQLDTLTPIVLGTMKTGKGITQLFVALFVKRFL